MFNDSTLTALAVVTVKLRPILSIPITWVETARVKDNQVLSLSINRQDVERCARVIRQYGLLTPPVVGDFPGGLA